MVLKERKDSTDEKLDDLMIFLIVYSWLSSTLYDLCTYFEPHIINVIGSFDYDKDINHCFVLYLTFIE